jgi:hypothetical protein
MTFGRSTCLVGIVRPTAWGRRKRVTERHLPSFIHDEHIHTAFEILSCPAESGCTHYIASELSLLPNWGGRATSGREMCSACYAL